MHSRSRSIAALHAASAPRPEAGAAAAIWERVAQWILVPRARDPEPLTQKQNVPLSWGPHLFCPDFSAAPPDMLSPTAVVARKQDRQDSLSVTQVRGRPVRVHVLLRAAALCGLGAR